VGRVDFDQAQAQDRPQRVPGAPSRSPGIPWPSFIRLAPNSRYLAPDVAAPAAACGSQVGSARSRLRRLQRLSVNKTGTAHLPQPFASGGPALLVEIMSL